MAGRNDFGVLRADLLSEDRAHHAADLYAERGWCCSDMAFGMVAGHVAMLGLHAMRTTDDGVLPGDGVSFVHAALLLPRPTARAVLEVLVEAGLMKRTDSGAFYLAGFRECYRPIIEARETDAERKRVKRLEQRLREERLRSELGRVEMGRDETVTNHNAPKTVDFEASPSDVRGMSVGRPMEKGPCPLYRTVPTVPTGPNPPSAGARAQETDAALVGDGSASEGGGVPSAARNESSGPGVPTAHQVAGARAMARVILDGRESKPERRREAAACLRALDAGTATARDIAEFARRNFANEAARIAFLCPPEFAHDQP